MIRTILFASDLGLLSTYSLVYVEELAKPFNAKVTLLHVVPPINALANAVANSRCSDQTKADVAQSSYIEGLLENIREQTFERLASDEFGLQFAQLLDDIVVVSGSPAKVIIDQAHRRQADVIVIGSCSEYDPATTALGSVANKVLQMARVPVYVVPLHCASPLIGGIAQVNINH